MGEYEEVSAGILRLVAALENEGNAVSQGRQGRRPALCFSCGPLAKGSGEVKLLSVKKSEVLLRALLVSQEDEEEILRRMIDIPVGVCGGCDKSLDTLVDLNQQLEDARLEFCGLRRRVGRQMILGSLGRKSHEKWLVDVESVEDVFPSKAPKRLRRSKDKAIGTDEVIKVEEDESDFDIIAGEVKLETEESDDGLEPRGNSGGDASAGSSWKKASEKEVRLTPTPVSATTMTTCRVMRKRNCEVPATNSRPVTPRKRRRSTHESEIKKPSCGQKGTKRVAGNGERSADEEESPEDSPLQKEDELGGGSRDQPSPTETPRRAVAINDRSFHAEEIEESLKRRSTFTRKPLPMSRCVRVTNKSSGGIIYYRPCKFCSKLFNSNYSVRRHCYVSHKAEYVKDLPFVCHVCYNLFPSTNTLEVHMKEHESLRCPTCHKYFPFQVKLKVHMRIHTGEKPYACDVCEQKFSWKQHAKEHMMTHSGVKPFVCSCGQGFNWKKSFKRHKTTTGHS